MATLGLVVGLVAAPQIGSPQAAQAAVTSGQVVFEQLQTGGNYPATIQQRASNGTLTNLSGGTPAYPNQDHQPAVSPDGSKIAFIGERANVDQPSTDNEVLMVMNSDGSGQTALVTPLTTGETDSNPVWSPDGTKIAFGQWNNGHYIAVINADGTGETTLTSGAVEYNPSWSPTKTSGHYLITYESDSGSGGNGQLYIMKDDGTSQHAVASSDTGYNDMAPTWSPDGNRIYFTSPLEGQGIWYYGSSTGFASGTPTRSTSTLSGTAGPDLTGSNAGNSPYVRVSADSSMLTYAQMDSSYCEEIWTLSSSGGTPTQLTTNGCSYSNWAPTFVSATWPTAPPSNSTVTINAATAHDAPYTRSITIGLSATGNKWYDYGWSTSSTTAPTANLQRTTDMVNRKGTLNYLGVLSGSTYSGGTQPNANWYLWVRSVQTGGTINAWGTPLLVHTPKPPVWVGVGDSYSSGHHQVSDEPLCPTAWDQTNNTYGTLVALTCNSGTGPSDFYPEDYMFSWIHLAVGQFNTDLNVPTAWTVQEHNVAVSGKATSDFGVTSLAAGTQIDQMRNWLYPQPDSWNIVSMTGGANDANFAGALIGYYSNLWHSGAAPPWAVTSVSNCPDTQTVYATATSAQSAIRSNLSGVVSLAVAASPGVRVLNVGYGYAVDSSNVCYPDNGSNHGVQSTLNLLNADHTAITGANVRYVDLTASTSMGTSPVSSGYIQETRLYGYPHPSATGQGKIKGSAITVLEGNSW